MKANDLYQQTTDIIIKQLEEGVPPWTRPWKEGRVKGVGMIPTNLITGRLYSGGNILLLWLAAQLSEYPSMQYCTYHQVNSIGASVRKGERATHVIFTKHLFQKDEATGEDKRSTLMKTYAVFNISQLEKVPDQYLAPQEPEVPLSDMRIKTFTGATGIKVSFGSNSAAYYPARDEIVMPSVGMFESQDAFTGTLMHEKIHGTSHKDRLNRELGKRFGDNRYAQEELIAELGSAFLCARLGIEPTFRSASYIESWIKVLKADSRAVLSAASYAGQASDWLWNKVYGKPEERREAAE